MPPTMSSAGESRAASGSESSRASCIRLLLLLEVSSSEGVSARGARAPCGSDLAKPSASTSNQTKLDIARAEAERLGVSNVEFHASDLRHSSFTHSFDVVCARFLLTHLKDPGTLVRVFCDHLRPGGRMAVEDVDFSGYFTYPDSPAFQRYRELYCATVIRRGGDPNIGPRLPSLLQNAGLTDVGVHIVQPVALKGDAKLATPLTMENIADTVLDDGLATREEIDRIVRELYEFAANPTTLAGTPRIVQSWGRRPD